MHCPLYKGDHCTPPTFTQYKWPELDVFGFMRLTPECLMTVWTAEGILNQIKFFSNQICCDTGTGIITSIQYQYLQNYHPSLQTSCLQHCVLSCRSVPDCLYFLLDSEKDTSHSFRKKTQKTMQKQFRIEHAGWWPEEKCEPPNIHRLKQFHCSQWTSGGNPFIVCSL